jgi:cysteine desulfurase / selenocysteine lyase
MENIIYLDNGATSFPKPEEVYSYMDRFYRNYGVNPGRSGYDLCMESGSMVDQTRALLSTFFGGKDPDRLIFSYNSTDALNLAISGMLVPGDHAITTTLEHNSVLRPLYHLQMKGVEVDRVPFHAKGFVDPGDFARMFKVNTRLVVVNHASNVIGTVQPIAEIGALCRQRGIRFLVDASQTAGKVPIDMGAQDLDVVAFTGHKSLLGPTGIGGLCVGEGVQIAFTRAGGTGVRSAVPTHLEEYPFRLEYGTVNLLGVAGLNAGIKWIQQRGMEKIHAHEMALITKLRDGLRGVDGVTLYCQEDLANHISVFLFNVDGLDAADTGIMLDMDHNIACRTGLHCAPLVHVGLGTDKIHGAVRFGVGPFNTEQHIDRAVEGVREIVKQHRLRSKK